MDQSLKKQLLSNISFVLLFSAVFAIYCQMATYLFKRADVRDKTAYTDSELPSKLIVIDPGHGGEDGGAIGINGVYEKELNLDTSETLSTFLIFAGFEVVQTRTEDVMLYDRSVDYKGRKKVLDLAARLKTAESLLPDLFVSIHMNSFPDSRYSGLTVYYSPNAQSGYEIAEKIRSDVIATLQPENRRELKKAGSNIYLLDRLKCPAILIECGFISNDKECAQLTNEGYRHQLSMVIFSSISDFFQE